MGGAMIRLARWKTVLVNRAGRFSNSCRSLDRAMAPPISFEPIALSRFIPA